MAELEFEGRILNAEPSPFDERDFGFRPDTATFEQPIPSRFIVKGLGPILNQGNTGTCGAHAGAGLRQAQQKADGKGVIPVDIFRMYDLVKTVVDKQPDPTRTKGTYIRSVLRLLKGTGTPLRGVAAAGAGGRILTYWRVMGSVEVDAKRALMQYGFPLMARSDWDAAWMRLPINKIVAQPSGVIVGGHIFLIIGWDDNVNGGSWIIRNSWGRWSRLGNGNGYMAMRYIRFRRPEFWASTDVDD